MTDSTPPSSGTTSALAGDKKEAAQVAIKVAKTGWAWTKKAAAFLWPRVKKGGKFVAEKVDDQMDKIVDSINQPKQHSAISDQQPDHKSQDGK